MAVKLTREPLYEQAYNAILRMILDGVLEPGERIRETSLANMLEVSATPIREAMRKLEHDGLLQSDGGSTRILELVPEDIRQLYACRDALEVVALRAAIDNVTDADIDELDAILTEAEKTTQTGDLIQLVRINTTFHDRIIQMAENPWLMSTIAYVRRPLLLARIQIIHDQHELSRLLNDHRDIWRALKKREVDEAVRVLRRHLKADCDYMSDKLMRVGKEME